MEQIKGVVLAFEARTSQAGKPYWIINIENRKLLAYEKSLVAGIEVGKEATLSYTEGKDRDGRPSYTVRDASKPQQGQGFGGRSGYSGKSPEQWQLEERYKRIGVCMSYAVNMTMRSAELGLIQVENTEGKSQLLLSSAVFFTDGLLKAMDGFYAKYYAKEEKK